MLTSEQVEDLRRRVGAYARKPHQGRERVATCIDGPLQGLRVPLEEGIYSGPEATFGWCQSTRDGPVLALYGQSGTPGAWRFRGYECPGWRDRRADGYAQT